MIFDGGRIIAAHRITTRRASCQRRGFLQPAARSEGQDGQFHPAAPAGSGACLPKPSTIRRTASPPRHARRRSPGKNRPAAGSPSFGRSGRVPGMAIPSAEGPDPAPGALFHRPPAKVWNGPAFGPSRRLLRRAARGRMLALCAAGMPDACHVPARIGPMAAVWHCCRGKWWRGRDSGVTHIQSRSLSCAEQGEALSSSVRKPPRAAQARRRHRASAKARPLHRCSISVLIRGQGIAHAVRTSVRQSLPKPLHR